MYPYSPGWGMDSEQRQKLTWKKKGTQLNVMNKYVIDSADTKTGLSLCCLHCILLTAYITTTFPCMVIDWTLIYSKSQRNPYKSKGGVRVKPLHNKTLYYSVFFSFGHTLNFNQTFKVYSREGKPIWMHWDYFRVSITQPGFICHRTFSSGSHSECSSGAQQENSIMYT